MAPRFEVRLKNTTGAYVAILTSWRRLAYSLKTNAPNSHDLLLTSQLAPTSEFVLDAQVEVWRSDLAIGLAPYLDYEGFHRTPVEQTTGDGTKLFTSYGQGYDDLLARRAILYYAGSAYTAKTGPGETVMKAFVNENAGPAATNPPRLRAGVTAGLTMQADGAAGLAWTGERAWRNLLAVVQEIAAATLVDFAVVGTGPATFEFQAKAYPFGADRSTAGLNPATGLNAAGNAPVVFSLAFGNLAVPTYSVNRTNEANVAVALGQGVDALRAIAIRVDPVAVADSPWNQREVTRNANTEDTAAGLDAVGDAVLAELMAQTSFSFSVLQQASSAYGKHYRIGDIIEARYGTFQKAFQIVGVQVVVAEGKETITVEVSDVSVTG